MKHPVTLDGRYFVVRGRLWLMANPAIGEAEQSDLVHRMMAARRFARDAERSGDLDAEAGAHTAVDVFKRTPYGEEQDLRRRSAKIGRSSPRRILNAQSRHFRR
jgi:hypothetical protein